MAPVPEDNQNTPPNANGEDSEHFSNPDLTIPIGVSDSSDSDDNEVTLGALNGYMPLPQEPEDDNSDNENIYSTENIGDSSHYISPTLTETLASGTETASADLLAETVISSEEGASVAPTVSALNDLCHPAFIARFPDGKMPSYMQVPKIQREKEEQLWNQQRQESSKLPLDPAHESKILKAMSQFSLPTENIPEWARHLSDDQWGQQILNHIGIASYNEKHSIKTKCSPQSDPADKKAQTKEPVATDDVWVASFADATTNDTE